MSLASLPLQIPPAEELYIQLRTAFFAVWESYDALVGIHTGGAWLAERLHTDIGGSLPLGRLDVSFYRDDLARRGLARHAVRPSDLPFAVEGARILLIDDVLYTGRTVRAALNELFDYGRPKMVRLAVLVDRGGRELPIAADLCPWRADPPLPPPYRLELTRRQDATFTWELSS
ncbi:MAG: bifunctional pyr operon transcriptional regulator/uracil phosphoribosyltransferase PyrR [Hydrogenophilus sp.]|nr:bifunctional pyr operon transcriptional regulator/uracil phosphoribosyltransferase PyrR [Hydrogenophilus sp.]